MIANSWVYRQPTVIQQQTPKILPAGKDSVPGGLTNPTRLVATQVYQRGELWIRIVPQIAFGDIAFIVGNPLWDQTLATVLPFFPVPSGPFFYDVPTIIPPQPPIPVAPPPAGVPLGPYLAALRGDPGLTYSILGNTLIADGSVPPIGDPMGSLTRLFQLLLRADSRIYPDRPRIFQPSVEPPLGDPFGFLTRLVALRRQPDLFFPQAYTSTWLPVLDVPLLGNVPWIQTVMMACVLYREGDRLRMVAPGPFFPLPTIIPPPPPVGHKRMTPQWMRRVKLLKLRTQFPRPDFP